MTYLCTMPHSRLATTTVRQQGFGLIQAMLVLLLLASILATATLITHAKRAQQQAMNQEKALRWADETLAAFALSQSRLPCPANQPNGAEDCTQGHGKGWLPLKTLQAASGSQLHPAPMAYVVYRGHAQTQPVELVPDPGLQLVDAGDGRISTDLAAPTPSRVDDQARHAEHNTYRPRGLDGNQRAIEDGDESNPHYRSFAAINSLDLCRKLELADNDSFQGTLASIDVAGDGTPVNVAYAIAAAGPLAGSQNALAGANGSNANSLSPPGQLWDSGYDDRVWLRSFTGLADHLGCRSYKIPPVTPASAIANASPGAAVSGNLSTIGVDLLASALSLHDTLASLQENNIGNTEVALIDAQFAQAAAVTAIVLSVGQIADATSSLITNSASLARAVLTCALSLGATCWEVPLKVASVAFSTKSLVANAIAGGLNVGALIPTALALDATLAARDRARKAAQPVAEDLDSAIRQLACSLYGSNAPEKGKTESNPCSSENIEEYERDSEGYPIPLLDDQNRQQFDANGNPLYKTRSGSAVAQTGLDERLLAAAQELDSITTVYNRMKTHRIELFDENNILSRIDREKSKGLHNNRYWPLQQYCRQVKNGEGTHWHSGEHVSQCTIAPPVDGSKVGNAVIDSRRVFNAALANSDAITKRRLSESWVLARQHQEDHAGELRQAINMQESWLTGSDPMIDRLRRDRDKECGKDMGNALNHSRCQSARASFSYMDTCIRDGVEDLSTDAMCRHRINDRVASLQAEKNSLGQTVSNAKREYDNAPSPFIVFPADWRYYSLTVTNDAAGNPVSYDWLDAYSQKDMQFVDLQGPYTAAYYSKYPDWLNGPLLDTSDLSDDTNGLCTFLWYTGGRSFHTGTGRHCSHMPYNRAYSDYLRLELVYDKKLQVHDQLALQFKQMESDYERLKCQRAQQAGDDAALEDLDKHYCSDQNDNGVQSSAIGTGGQSLLERADNRGAIGPRKSEAH